ncbi:uncharacterized protein TRUGW13939_01667 [Talaromyces rugulosus]|uniref:NAD(P)-binding domain-containing protein n=1 Tax=Talaromyces rugulosus TaxID=121627 RepID=A0A7H8QKT7_TALRU|nr:uncharacterized protein TRUGW13939_01667 [Talaromyces rugulosus]QKX54580.1 hypothetical protein TRUGW13939_01667 [Talaromyces rugulosus]
MPIPVIIIGRTAAIGATVAKHLAPDYEVIRFIQSLRAAKTELPYILSKREPPNSTTTTATSSKCAIGSNDYTRGARAVIFGRAFTLAQAEEVRRNTTNQLRVLLESGNNKTEGKDAVTWMVGDPSLDLTQKPAVGAGYAENAVREVKAVLKERIGEEGIILY